MKLPSPQKIRAAHPLPSPFRVAEWRRAAQKILTREDERLVAIIGPCSVHDSQSTLEYAAQLKALLPEIEEAFFPIMRVFIEKPRTKLGWKGMLYDPHLDESYDLAAGLKKSRELLLQICEMGIPCATEFLEPIAAPYFEDLITWGLIGARTSASQPHRQMASGFPFPVGFKNDFHGQIDVALGGILVSQMPHTYLGMDREGHVAALQTHGNPFSHLVLRGSEQGPNYDSLSVQKALHALEGAQLPARLLIDCAHGNSEKDYRKQNIVLESIIEQAGLEPRIAGFMLESHLFSGKQLLSDPQKLRYGVSVTDPCLGWEETASVLRSMSMSLVQKWCSHTSITSPHRSTTSI